MRARKVWRSKSYGAAAALLCPLALVGVAIRPVGSLAKRRICTAAANKSPPGNLTYGRVHFANSCKAEVQGALQLEIAKLHSFEADARSFAAITKKDPRCAIAWWGAAMSARGNPLAGSLDENTLQIGRKLVERALAVHAGTPREKDLIGAMDLYYRPYPDQTARARVYAERMDAIHVSYPDDPDIGALDGLAIIEGVDLNDKTYARQKRAGPILEAVMTAHPENPGAPHYLIHAYDYTALAPMAVHAAEIYPTIATASSHAQHMPAHIWSMLGRWDKSIDANRRASFLADRSSAHDRVKGDIVFEHAFDFIAYARLQKGQDRHLGEDLAALTKAPPVVVARYALERGDWIGAMHVPVPADDAFDAALARFTRAYGAAHAGDVKTAQRELNELRGMRGRVATDSGEYWGVFVDIYIKTAAAWISKAVGRNDAALTLMRDAAIQDDGHEKHIYLENKILPMRESLADMELALGQSREALGDYEMSLKLAPNRYRSFAGAAKAAEALHDTVAAREWWSKLTELAKDGDHSRPDDQTARTSLLGNG